MSEPLQVKKFMQAVHRGGYDTVRSMATLDPAIVYATNPDSFGATSLIQAVHANDRAMVDLLLELGADIDQRSDWWAGSFGVLDSADDEMSAHLLDRGATLTPHAAARLGKIAELRAMLAADPSVVKMRGGDGQMPLHFARTAEIADLLLAHGAEIDARDIDHASTPAQWLVSSRPETAAHLVSRGAAPDPFLAVRAGDAALLERLVKQEPLGVMVRVSHERFPGPAPAAGHIYMFTIGEGCTLLHAAASSDQPAIIRWLAANGADVNARGGYDNGTPLHSAAWCDKPDATAALIDAGADMNLPSGHMHHNEPIGWAIVSGAFDAFRVLLNRGAAVRPAHIEDAKMGVNGAFREFNPRRPIESWREIQRLLNARS